MVRSSNKEWIQKLKEEVEGHPVLNHPWFLKQKEEFHPEAFYLWLTQEYHVSVSFVDWFLITATKTQNQSAKIVLVQNIWEELGEGNIQDTHVSILESFLKDLKVPDRFFVLLPETKEYLNQMKRIVDESFFHGLGALGPANEYLLKREYHSMSLLYKGWREEVERVDGYSLPEPKFFQVNLNADEGHAARLFALIEELAVDKKNQEAIEEGNKKALDARLLFYEGLWKYFFHLPVLR